MAEWKVFRKGVLFVAIVALIYLSVFVFFENLQCEVDHGEGFFWQSSLHFSDMTDIRQVGSYSSVHTYNYPTPLTFMIFGALERVFGGGIFAARLLNFLVSFSLLMIVAFAGRRVEKGTVLSAICLLSFPYFMFTSVYVYTDMIASAFVLLGFMFHRKGRFATGAVFFVLAISSRQLLIAVPLVLFLYEFMKSRKRYGRWIPPFFACSSIFIWFLVLGGLSPPALGTGIGSPENITFVFYPDHGLYMLSCLGFYFVIPEFILFRRHARMNAKPGGTEIAVIALLLLLFISFPPLGNPEHYEIESMGALDTGLRMFMGDMARVSALFVLASLTVLRFRKPVLSSIIVLTFAFTACFSLIGWDKYILPLLIILWYMKSRDVLDKGALKLNILDNLRQGMKVRKTFKCRSP